MAELRTTWISRSSRSLAKLFWTYQKELTQIGAREGLLHCFEPSGRFGLGAMSYINVESRDRSLRVQAFHTFPDDYAIVKSQSVFTLPGKMLRQPMRAGADGTRPGTWDSPMARPQPLEARAVRRGSKRDLGSPPELRSQRSDFPSLSCGRHAVSPTNSEFGIAAAIARISAGELIASTSPTRINVGTSNRRQHWP